MYNVEIWLKPGVRVNQVVEMSQAAMVALSRSLRDKWMDDKISDYKISKVRPSLSFAEIMEFVDAI